MTPPEPQTQRQLNHTLFGQLKQDHRQRQKRHLYAEKNVKAVRKALRSVVATGGTPAGAITLRLDARTVVTVKDAAAVERWRGRYPGLVVVPLAGSLPEE